MINRANDSITNDSLAKQVADLHAELRATKSTQIVGADTILTQEAGPTSLTLAGITPGQGFVWQVNWFTTAKLRFLSEMKISVFIDHDLDPDYLWPLGLHVNAN